MLGDLLVHRPELDEFAALRRGRETSGSEMGPAGRYVRQYVCELFRRINVQRHADVIREFSRQFVFGPQSTFRTEVIRSRAVTRDDSQLAKFHHLVEL